jgi:hypothetical protein
MRPQLLEKKKKKKGHENLKVTPSSKRRDRLVIWTISRLFPVMSSTFITFQTPVVSGVHVKEHCPPSLNTAPGPGAVGTGSALMDGMREMARREMRAMVLNIGNTKDIKKKIQETVHKRFKL